MTLTNPNRFSTAGTSGTLGHITDAVDFPHSGLIKSLSLGMRGNYAVKTTNGFNITQASSGNVIQVTSGFVFANGHLFPCDAKNFADSVFTTSPANVSHLLVADVGEAQADRLKIIPHGANTANRIPDYVDGNDVIIAVITYTTGFGSMTVQYLTTDKTSNSLSVGYNNSGYDQTMSITGGSGKTTLLSEENQVVLKLNGTGSSNNFTITDSADQTQFAVKGDGTLETDLTASRALVTDASKNISVSSVTSTELALLSGAAFGIGNNNILRANANLADNDFLRVDGTQIEGRTAAQTLSDIGAINAAGAISAVEGEATLALTGSVTVATGQTFTTPRLPTVSVSASTTLTEATHAGRYLICAGNVTLPATSSAGEHYTILNTTGGNITVGRNGNNINGAGSDATVATFNGVTCIAIGSNNWIALGV